MDPQTGGVCQGIRNMIAGFSLLDIDNEVVCLDPPQAAFLQERPCRLHALGRGRSPWWYGPALLPWLKGNLSRFDYVIVHGLWLYPAQATFRALKSLQSRPGTALPAVYMMPHGMLDPYFQHGPGRRLKAMRNRLYWRAIEKDNINQASGLLFTCETEMRLARNTFKGYRPQAQHNIGYGVLHPPAYTPAMRAAFLEKTPGLGREQPYLLFLSRIHPKKGIDLLLRAYEALLQAPGPDLPPLVIAGPGLETPFGQHLSQYVAQHPALSRRVHFTGMLEGEAKWGSFYGCEAFILPSHQENFGIAVAEAMSCHKPVLLSDQVNIWQEIIDGGGGLVSTDTQEGTRKLLEQWLTLPPDARQRMGRDAAAVFERCFTIEAIARNFVSILKIRAKKPIQNL